MHDFRHNGTQLHNKRKRNATPQRLHTYKFVCIDAWTRESEKKTLSLPSSIKYWTLAYIIKLFPSSYVTWLCIPFTGVLFRLIPQHAHYASHSLTPREISNQTETPRAVQIMIYTWKTFIAFHMLSALWVFNAQQCVWMHFPYYHHQNNKPGRWWCSASQNHERLISIPE